MSETENKPHVSDRTGWPAGPWDAEPEDKVQWYDETTGLACLAVRGPVGSWCGYVGVPPGHRWHKLDYSGRIDGGERDWENSPESKLDVHGGITFSGACHGPICHVPKPGESPDTWWFGFDTAHSGDASPGLLRFRADQRRPMISSWDGQLTSDPFGETYKPLSYIKAECARLAAQLAAVEPQQPGA